MNAAQRRGERDKPAAVWAFDKEAFDGLPALRECGGRPAAQARLLQVHRTTVGRIKALQVRPSAVEMLRWAEVLECDVKDFHRKIAGGQS